MRKKITSKVNGGLALYYGIGSFLVGIVGLVAVGIWLYKAFTNQAEFSWGTLAGLCVLVGATGFIGFALMRVGYEELEE